MEQYTELQKLGEGAFGEVYTVRSKDSGGIYVMKKIRISSENKRAKEDAMNEIKLLKELTHPNIVGYKDALEDEHFVKIIMEYCEKGDLDQQITDRREGKLGSFPEKQILVWFKQLCSAVQYIHTRGILHRDIKPANIFLMASNDVKLGDFGFAKQLTKHSGDPNVLLSLFYKAATFAGTRCYMAPEVWRSPLGIPYDRKCDVWSLGCVIYELVAIEPAFYANNLIDLGWKIVTAPSPVPVGCSQLLQRVVSKMLTKSPGARPSIDDVVHEFKLEGPSGC